MNTNLNFASSWVQWQQTMLDEGMAMMGRMTHLPTLWQRAQHIRKGVSPAD